MSWCKVVVSTVSGLWSNSHALTIHMQPSWMNYGLHREDGMEAVLGGSWEAESEGNEFQEMFSLVTWGSHCIIDHYV
jgi:hypothetical protein